MRCRCRSPPYGLPPLSVPGQRLRRVCASAYVCDFALVISFFVLCNRYVRTFFFFVRTAIRAYFMLGFHFVSVGDVLLAVLRRSSLCHFHYLITHLSLHTSFRPSISPDATISHLLAAGGVSPGRGKMGDGGGSGSRSSLQGTILAPGTTHVLSARWSLVLCAAHCHCLTGVYTGDDHTDKAH